MIELTTDALAVFDSYFGTKEKQIIKIFLVSGGCQGPRLAMDFRKADDNDSLISNGSYSFFIDKDLLASIKALKISYDKIRGKFLLEPKKPYSNVSACETRCGGCGIIQRSSVPFNQIFSSEALC